MKVKTWHDQVMDEREDVVREKDVMETEDVQSQKKCFQNAIENFVQPKSFGNIP